MVRREAGKTSHNRSTGRLLVDVRAPVIPAAQRDAVMHEAGKFSKFSSSSG